MAEARAIPADTLHAQAQASDPSASAWVSANAGSGKTFVLARRVIRLMLAGVPPARILCLTFTKAAAAEMSNRVFETLGKWAAAEQAWLDGELETLLGRKPGRHETERARTLFAMALDTPGGLKVQTIHALSEALLHQFPLEANVPGQFEVIDEMRQAELLAEAKSAVFAAMQHGGEKAEALRRSFAWLIDHASDMAIDKALGEIIARRTRFADWAGGDLANAIAPLWRRFGLSPEMTRESLIGTMLAETSIDRGELRVIAETAQQAGGTTNLGFAGRAEAFLAANDPNASFRLRNELFLTKQGAARKQFITKTVLAEYPGADEHLAIAAAQALDDAARLAQWRMLRASEALFHFADEFLDAYESLKRRHGLVDFDDLIAQTSKLLNRADMRHWVRYKLDQGIDHVLIDEAQDTSREQWDIVNAITAEFFAGIGADRGAGIGRTAVSRTVFAVGDEKQSIFSFQGAAPEMFAAQARLTRAGAEAAGAAFHSVPLRLSFRSSPDILGAVDRVFSLPENVRGLGEDANEGTVHDAIRASDPGEVRIWPVVVKQKAAEKTEWLAPIDAEEPGDPALKLAKRIAETIAGWMKSGEKLPGRETPIRHGDILILVRRRDRFMTAVIRELKQAGLAIAGADRLKLTEHIAIEDLLALGRVMVLPEDDLTLAGILKSPLFGLNDDDLIELCKERKGTPLIAHLAALAAGEGPVAGMATDVSEKLERLRRVAAQSTAYGFYAHVLGAEGGRKAFAARLGNEAEDVLDAFEAAALDHDRQAGKNGGGTGLESFISDLSRASPEIKRDVDVRRDEIRVITVHAAKGLEAPIVFLVDPCSPAFITQHAPSVISMDGEDGGYVWATGAKTGGPEIEARFDRIRAGAEEEYRRLLYVAMTRAADRLIVCGYRGLREPPADHWHAMISRALEDDADKVFDEDGEIAEMIWRSPDKKIRDKTRERPVKEAREAETDHTDIPQWLYEKAKPEPALPRPLNPSTAMALTMNGAGGAIPAEPEMAGEPSGEMAATGEQRRVAIERGTAIHRLLQMLPDTDEGERRALAAMWLERNYPDWELSAREAALSEAMHIIDAPALATLFGTNSRAEAGIAGKVTIGGREVTVAGQVDRLAVLDGEIIIADYKTNRQIPESGPESQDEIDPAYRLQLALYRALLEKIYPGKNVRCLLIWTRTGGVSELDAGALDAALSAIAMA